VEEAVVSTWVEGSKVVVGDEVRVQRGEHAGKAGTVSERDGIRLRVNPWPGASWVSFWIDDCDVAGVRP
jgi:transcription elongation factor